MYFDEKNPYNNGNISSKMVPWAIALPISALQCKSLAILYNWQWCICILC